MSSAAEKRAHAMRFVLAEPGIDRLIGVLTLLGYKLTPVRLPKILRKRPVCVHLVFRQIAGGNVATLRYQKTVSLP